MSGARSPEPQNPERGGTLPVLAGAALIVLGLCVLWIVWGSVRDQMRPMTLSVRLYTTPAATPFPAPVIVTPPAAAASPVPETDEPPPMTPPRLDLQSGNLAWELQLDAVLKTQLPDRDKALYLLKQLGFLPPEAMERVTQEAVDRLPDRDYSAALPLLLSPETHGAVESILFADLLERPDEITLPALLSLARSPMHPFAQAARESLALLVGGDHGTDWSGWEKAVGQLLAEESQK